MYEIPICEYVSEQSKRRCECALEEAETKDGLCAHHLKMTKEVTEEVKKNSTLRKTSKLRYYLKWKHKMTLEAYENQFNAQNGRCAACKMEDTRRLAVDQVPGIGLIGLLCSKCDLVVRLYRKNLHVQAYLSKKEVN